MPLSHLTKKIDQPLNIFEAKFVRLWNWLILKEWTQTTRTLITLAIASTGYLLISLIYMQTHVYFASITIASTVLIALIGEFYLNYLIIIVLSLLAEYFYVPPNGSFLTSTASRERLIVILVVSLFTHTLVYSLRNALYRMALAKKEAELAKKEAITANMTKNAFLANMSHEIRTPLGAIMGFSELIIDPNISSEEKENYITIIKRNGELLSNIIRDILDLSKVEAGKLDIIKKPSLLSEILSDTKALLNLKAEEKGVELKIIKEGQLPLTIDTDALRLRQILINIIGNAIKFTNRGHVTVRVSIKKKLGAEANDILCFEVKDTGKGIDKNQIAQLFGAFSQAHSDSRELYGGTGLGLNLSKRLARLLGGDIVLTQTEKNVGSTFLITVDLGASVYESPEISESALVPITISSSSQTSKSLHGINILLTDDAEDMQLLTSHILKKVGASVDLAKNGMEAVEKVHQKHYDILLMDIQMPIMNGYEATAHLRQEGYQDPIIALTAHALSEEQERCLAAGFNSYLTKPINIHQLLDQIYKTLKINENTKQKIRRPMDLHLDTSSQL